MSISNELCNINDNIDTISVASNNTMRSTSFRLHGVVVVIVAVALVLTIDIV